jgi:hypothetical protein
LFTIIREESDSHIHPTGDQKEEEPHQKMTTLVIVVSQ